MKIEDPSGKVLEEFNENRGKRETLDPQVAYEMSAVLSDNDARSTVFGSRSPLYFADRPVAVKTGTTQEFRDGWTIGYTPSMATGVWVGNNDNHPMKNGSDGVVVAAPIFHAYMASALAGTPSEQFERPSEVKEFTVDKLSNRLPTDSSPETVTDIFTKWQVPTEKDNIHIKVKVNKLNGLLATEFTPAELVEERTYTNLHSEKPTNSNWEGPVLSWARDNGIEVNSPPTEKDTLYTEGNRPTVKITSPSNGQELSGAFTIKATIGGSIGVTRVEAFIDNQSIGSRDAAPYEFPYDTAKLAVGTHELRVAATDTNNATAASSLTLTVGRETTPPSDTKSVTATGTNGSVTLSWQNPLDADLERIHIYVSTIAGSIGNRYPTDVIVQPNSVSTFSIPNLVNGTAYFFTLRAADTSGNESAGSAAVTATPHP